MVVPKYNSVVSLSCLPPRLVLAECKKKPEKGKGNETGEQPEGVEPDPKAKAKAKAKGKSKSNPKGTPKDA